MNARTMTRWIFVGALAALSVAGCGSADRSSAQSVTGAAAEAQPGGGGGRFMRDPAMMVARFDANHDGALQVGELPERMAARLGAADTDHNGVITTDELTAFHTAQRAARGDGWFGHGGPGMGGHGFGGGGQQFRGGAPDPARMIQRFDANGDGVLQVSELPERMASHLGAADTDHDGTLSATELTTAMEQRRAEHAAREAQDAPANPTAPTAPTAPAAPTQ